MSGHPPPMKRNNPFYVRRLQTWHNFTRLMKWTVIISALILLGMAATLT